MQNREIHMMGTIIQLSVQHKYAAWVLEELVIRIQELEKRFSAHDPDSELMEVNRNAGIRPVEVHPELYELIKIGKKHSTAPGSNLNITIGPLVKAWRIGFEDAKIPSDPEIRSLLGKTDASRILLDDGNRTVFLEVPGMFIDLGALAKGYIADLLIKDLELMEAEAAIVNLGGNVMTWGMSPNQEDGRWRVGIQHPSLPRGNYLAIAETLNQSVVTSGIYERSFTAGGRTYHHILDPATGYPIESEIAGLTIISRKSVDGEVWTSRLFGKSPGEVFRELDNVEDAAGIVVTKDGRLQYSESLAPCLAAEPLHP